MVRNIRVRNSRLAWGFSLILVAALILANHFGGLVDLSVWSIVFSALAVIVLVDCLANLHLAALPLPIAALYYIFQEPLELPNVRFWLLALVTVLVIGGLYAMLPRRFRKRKYIEVNISSDERRSRREREKYSAKYGQSRANNGTDAETVVETVIEGVSSETVIEEGDDANNPYISVKMGGVSRYLQSDRLETAVLSCDLGSLEVYFDHVKLSPDGADAHISCRLGSIEMYVPGHWRVVNNLGASLGSAEVDRSLESAPPDAPTLTLSGSVSLGSVEVRRIRG